jgi:uracil-DNA glycosylase
MGEQLPTDWREALEGRFDSRQLSVLQDFVTRQRTAYPDTVFPPAGQVFEAFCRTPFAQVRAVILGQDPYPTPGQACGLAFSVREPLPDGVRRPQSLGAILAEVRRDLGVYVPRRATLDCWAAEEGVLLLNTALTFCAKDEGGEHAAQWDPFTRAVIGAVVSKPTPVPFLLWGRRAQQRGDLISPPHMCIRAPHPAARGKAHRFAGSKPFSRTNDWIRSQGLDPIDWSRF